MVALPYWIPAWGKIGTTEVMYITFSLLILVAAVLFCLWTDFCLLPLTIANSPVLGERVDSSSTLFALFSVTSLVGEHKYPHM